MVSRNPTFLPNLGHVRRSAFALANADASTVAPHNIGNTRGEDCLSRTVRNIQAIHRVNAVRIHNQGPQRAYLLNGVFSDAFHASVPPAPATIAFLQIS